MTSQTETIDIGGKTFPVTAETYADIRAAIAEERDMGMAYCASLELLDIIVRTMRPTTIKIGDQTFDITRKNLAAIVQAAQDEAMARTVAASERRLREKQVREAERATAYVPEKITIGEQTYEVTEDSRDEIEAAIIDLEISSSEFQELQSRVNDIISNIPRQCRDQQLERKKAREQVELEEVLRNPGLTDADRTRITGVSALGAKQQIRMARVYITGNELSKSIDDDEDEISESRKAIRTVVDSCIARQTCPYEQYRMRGIMANWDSYEPETIGMIGTLTLPAWVSYWGENNGSSLARNLAPGRMIMYHDRVYSINRISTENGVIHIDGDRIPNCPSEPYAGLHTTYGPDDVVISAPGL